MNLGLTQKVVKVIPAKIDISHESKNRPRKRVCAYCRVSTDELEQQSSYDLQVSYYTDFIQKNEFWEFSGIYADEGISGTSIKNRTEFQRMIEDCMAGKIDLILTKSISRFARNTLDCLNHVRMLKGLPSPVGIYFEKENIDTLDAKSELLLTILSSLAQDESRSISENVRWSIQKKYQQGKVHFPTTLLLGYDSTRSGKIIVNEEQAQTVRRIYQEFIDGKGTEKIAQGLTRDKVLTGAGKTNWVGNSVYRILTNEKYCGDVLTSKKVTLDFLTHKRMKNKGHQPQYFVSNHHPAIIPREMWQAVQLELKQRNKFDRSDDTDHPQKQNKRSLFSNVLFCASCGQPLIRKTYTSYRRGNKYYYTSWKCRVADDRDQLAECGARSYREEAIKHTFMVMLQEMKNELDVVITDAKKQISSVDLDNWEKDRLIFLEAEIERQKEFMSQLSISTDSEMPEEIYHEMNDNLQHEIDTLKSELDLLLEKQQEVLTAQENFDWFIQALDTLSDFESESERPEFREDIFNRIVARGDVFDDGSIQYELNIGLTRKAINTNRHIWKKKMLTQK